jgi:hypothetical protein
VHCSTADADDYGQAIKTSRAAPQHQIILSQLSHLGEEIFDVSVKHHPPELNLWELILRPQLHPIEKCFNSPM